MSKAHRKNTVVNESEHIFNQKGYFIYLQLLLLVLRLRLMATSYEYGIDVGSKRRYSMKYRPKPIEFQELNIVTALVLMHCASLNKTE